VLEHLAAHHQLRRVPFRVELLDRDRLELDRDAGGVPAAAGLLEHLGEGVAGADAQPPARQPDRQLALAAADLVGLPCSRALDELVQLPEEAGHQPPGDRVRGPVLVVDVSARLGGGHAHLAIVVLIVSTVSGRVGSRPPCS
jgi:hypothetical protein